MTGKFCKLGRNAGNEGDLGQIKDNEGRKFNNRVDRNNHITGFYSELYKKKLDRLIAIEDFLGREAIASARVQESKLTAEERDTLEGEVTIEEMYASLLNSNLESTSGWDGISFKTLKKYWQQLGVLSTKMANESFREGIMTDSFRLGLIKLIPKKGDCSKVQDWRPITLLSCGYKIISGVVATRLEKYLGKIIGRSQKGFLKHKNINTVTVNIINNISGSWHNREEMGVLCVDFNKAFDSIEHSFIRSVLEFFNFGPGMVNMVGTILNRRQASIILEDCDSEKFNIGRSTPQGDRASPYIFILCAKVLLIKINSESGGRIGICEHMSRLGRESGIESGISEAYADDLTVMFKYSTESLKAILNILDVFHTVSGLSVNISKTQLMVVGMDRVKINTIVEGIKVVDKVKVLGVIIHRNIERLEENWELIIGKMQNLERHWRQFKLSITGRVGIIKTYLLSQCIYLLNCIPLPDGVGDRINALFVNYVRGGEVAISRDRIFNKIKTGG